MFLVLIAALAACSSPPASTAPVAGISAEADCLAPQVVEELGLTVPPSAAASESASVPPAGFLPDGFLPESVLVCWAGEILHDRSGSWVAITATRREGDLTELLAALDEPSQSCETSATVVPTVLWLVDALGRAVRPVWPVDRCGAPAADVAQAVAALDETSSTAYPVELITPTGPPAGT